MAVIAQTVTERFALYNADCMEVLPDLKADSVGLSVYSPPFPELYQYSNDPRDMSNCTRYEEGVEQYAFVVEQVYRLTRPGRLSCVHCMDLKKGSYYRQDFPGDIVRVHEAAGFHYWGRVTIWKDPWLVARRTRMRQLMHKNLVQDGTLVSPAGADYVLLFKKGGANRELVGHAHGLREYAGGREVPPELLAEFKDFTGDQRANRLSHWIFRQYMSPVWMDVRPGRLLPHKEARDADDEKHVCPLQLDVVDRLLTLWSNPGDVVLDPFMGVGSTPRQAVRMGRRALGCELKSVYYRQALENLQTATEDAPAEEGEQDRDLFGGVSEEEPEPEEEGDGEGDAEEDVEAEEQEAARGS